MPRGGIYSQQNDLGLKESGEGRQQDPEGGESPPEETREMREETSTAHSLSIPFCETGLSSVFLPSYNKAACLLLSRTNIVEAPGNHKGFLVPGDTRATSYFVAVKKNGVCICQWEGFKTASLCSHSLAVADHIEQRYHLKWLDKPTARVCYGCRGKL